MLDPLADLRARFVARTRERVAALGRAIEHIAADPGAPATIVDLTHQLAGSAGTFGYTALSEAAATLEGVARQRCSPTARPDGKTLEEAFSRIESCTASLAVPPRTSSP
jgi:HPt (histidine-containing phosphotransfer) domain-containing protein